MLTLLSLLTVISILSFNDDSSDNYLFTVDSSIDLLSAAESNGICYLLLMTMFIFFC